jgi:hypothetical protein
MTGTTSPLTPDGIATASVRLALVWFSEFMVYHSVMTNLAAISNAAE